MKEAIRALLIIVAAGLAGPLFATTWYVDAGNLSCSDAGSGTLSTPFCTIKPGATKAVAGDTVLVQPATYREQVTPAASGLDGAPITYLAAGSGVIILGTLDVSDPAGWTATTTNAWSRPYAPPSAPKQVFVDDVPLTLALSADTTVTNSFFYDTVAKVLYVDIGGLNPGDGHLVEAGARTYGFLVSAKNYIVIDGFDIRRPNNMGVRVATTDHVTVHNCVVTQAASYGISAESTLSPVLIQGNTLSAMGSVGIRLLNSSGVTVDGNVSHDNDFHGISLTGSSNNLVTGNTAYADFKPNVRSANGINVTGSSNNNIIAGNTAYGNQDSGIQVYTGSTGNLVVRNVSWGNGDHGFDTNQATGTMYISNTAYHNFKDGFSVEGSAINTTLENNIAVDNGLTTNEFDLYVDSLSTSGLVSDYNLFWNSTVQTPVKFGGVLYASVAAFSLATGQEIHGLGVDPLFVNSAAGDLHLLPGSPAIDAADAGAPGFQAADRDGRDPVDRTDVPDTGAGIPTYADRGAFEQDSAPVASLVVTPASGVPPLAVTADASGSTDPDSTPIASYLFDFGDGATVGPQSGATAGHTYTGFGVFVVTVTVTDTIGQSGTASFTVRAADDPPVARLSLTPTSGLVNLTVTADASASTDTDPTPIASYQFNFGDGTVVGPQAGSSAVHVYTTAGTFTASVLVTDTAGLSSTASGTVTVTDNPPVARLKVTPTGGKIPLTVRADASASTDSDGTPIANYIFDFGDGIRTGLQTSPIAAHIYTKVGTFTLTVTVTDTSGRASTAFQQVKPRKK